MLHLGELMHMKMVWWLKMKKRRERKENKKRKENKREGRKKEGDRGRDGRKERGRGREIYRENMITEWRAWIPATPRQGKVSLFNPANFYTLFQNHLAVPAAWGTTGMYCNTVGKDYNLAGMYHKLHTALLTSRYWKPGSTEEVGWKLHTQNSPVNRHNII